MEEKIKLQKMVDDSEKMKVQIEIDQAYKKKQMEKMRERLEDQLVQDAT